MSIPLSAAFQAAMAGGPKAGFFYCVRLFTKAGTTTKAITSHSSDVVIEGVTYDADGTLLSVDPPTLSTEVDRQQYKIHIADPTFLEGVNIETGLIGRFASVRFCVVDPITGDPHFGTGDNILIYQGRIDQTNYLTKTERLGENVLQLVCASPVANLDQKRGLYTSRDFIRGRNPDDSSCDSVSEGSGSLYLKWGKS
jgi:hypothetical protein